MTFNTTFIPIERLREQKFVEYESPRSRINRKRRIFVAPEIGALLNGDGAIDAMFPSVEAERVLSSFIAGYLVTLSRKGTKCDLEQLIGLDEVSAQAIHDDVHPDNFFRIHSAKVEKMAIKPPVPACLLYLPALYNGLTLRPGKHS